jgi:cytochrome c oxidase subunit 2
VIRVAKEVKVRKSRFERVLSLIIIVLLALSTYSVVYWYQGYRFPILGGGSNSKVFYVAATMWEFYPKEITVQKGDNVTIHLSSLDVTHGLHLKAWNITTYLSPNQTFTVNFTADQVGRFEYYCTVYCGLGHNDMKGYIIVKEKD